MFQFRRRVLRSQGSDAFDRLFETRFGLRGLEQLQPPSISNLTYPNSRACAIVSRFESSLSLSFILNVIARRDAYINHADETRLNCGNAFFKYHLELGRFGHWANADGALHARHAGDVNVGIVQALADPAILYRPAAPLCHLTADGARR